ncbi:hypothetical protein PO124_31960 [Bacillus licheniformis]|nr:hypothetical protein [Bacillus licheniformis]
MKLKAESSKLLIRFLHFRILATNVADRLQGETKPVLQSKRCGVQLVCRKYAKADVLKGREGTVLGFIGGIKPKLDLSSSKKLPEQKRVDILFVGPDGTNGDEDFKALLEEDNVIWTGPAAPSEVPAYMNVVDIGIMPYKPSPYNNAVFPLKLFEFWLPESLSQV